LKRGLNSPIWHLAANTATATLVAVGVLLSTFLAVTPELHAQLHPKGVPQSQPTGEHQCAATLFAKGAVETTHVPPIMTRWWDAPKLATEIAGEFFLPVMEYRLLPERAPPPRLILVSCSGQFAAGAF
jgi:hypothetical protein